MAASEKALRLVEECVGVGEIALSDRVLAGVRYDVRRFQAFTPSGMPVPGLHRIEGRIGFEDERPAVPCDCTLRLEDGRSLRITIVDADGHVLAEGHGPSRCHCC
ncbi:MAG TPA: hypothetical protein VF339_00415 [Gammaproteobacteria bacterium]